MKLLLTGAYNYSKQQVESIKNLGYDITFVQDEREKLNINLAEIDAVVCNGLFLYNDISEFSNLKLVQLTSAGLDRVNINEINKRGIKIFNAGGVYSAPMAEWAVLKVLEYYKKSFVFNENQKNKLWSKQRDLLEITDKNVCIVGTGNVGTNCAKRFFAFDANVIGVDIKNNDSGFFSEQYDINDIDIPLAKSDIVILTLPLTDNTKHMFNDSLFSKFKDNSIIINIARGAIIEESALINALESGKIAYAGLDVFENEPLPVSSAYWNMKNVSITPHNSFVSDKTNERLFKVIYNNLREFYEKTTSD